MWIDHLEKQGIYRRIILKCISRELGGRILRGFVWLRVGIIGRPCAQYNEPSPSTKFGDVLTKLATRDYCIFCSVWWTLWICRKGRPKNWFTTLLVFVFYRNYILKFSSIAWSWLFRPRAVFIKATIPTGNSLVTLSTFTHLSSGPVFVASLSSYGLMSVQFERPNVFPSCNVLLERSAPAEHRGGLALL
jgi:hypothetical protein